MRAPASMPGSARRGRRVPRTRVRCRRFHAHGLTDGSLKLCPPDVAGRLSFTNLTNFALCLLAGHHCCCPVPATLLCVIACAVPVCTDPPTDEVNLNGYDKDGKPHCMRGENMNLHLKQYRPLTRAGSAKVVQSLAHADLSASTRQGQTLLHAQAHVFAHRRAAHAASLLVLVVASDI